LHTILQRDTPEGLVNRLELNVESGSNLTDLLETLDMEMDPESILLVVNGRTADPSRKLRDGDQVNLMPAISGGCFFW
jgi:sulfur carrier protein ThiS